MKNVNKLLTNQNITKLLTGGGKKLEKILIIYEHGGLTTNVQR
jgi:hypothetical protein